MQSFRNILVGVDLSHADRIATDELSLPTVAAVHRAIQFAGHLGAEITFFAVLDLSAQALELIEQDDELPSHHNVEDSAHEVLAELVQQAAEAGITATGKVVIGKSWVEMIKEVLKENHDLVMIGTRNKSRVSQILFGSTGMKLLRKCPCPVWVIRPDLTPKVYNVLVASDFSDVSQRALDIAVNGAQMEEANVHLITAIEDHLSRRMKQSGVSQEKVEAYRESMLEKAECELHSQLTQTDHRTLAQPVQVHVGEGPADLVVLDAIDKYEIDLLVMGTVARGGIAGMIVGNTAEQLLPQVPCSLLAIKPDDFVCPITLES
ncbi:Universal stress protein E [hydrothermal vent metagenome]|uniref:Universal stress protein E n=1 Tax=hydrothermal vent metagenome TaxID=652676 RepID=A0A3B1DZ61_9ZZZZ